MNTKQLNKIFTRTMYVMVILALALSVTGSAYAEGPAPWLIAFPENDAVEGWEWPEGATVTLTIDHAPDGFYREGIAEVTTWGDPRTYVRFDFADAYNLQVGDAVTLTDGTITRTHTVQNLTVTKVDQEEDIVKGAADTGAEIYVWPHATGQQQIAIANPQGKWNVDFTGIYDLMPRDGGRAEVRDEVGNATAVDWYIPQPRFTIFPDAQWFDGIDWPDGANVTITVKNKPECMFTRESWGGFFNGGFPEGCVVNAGDRVTFTDGIITRKHMVQNLAITMIDKEANTVTGIADSGAVINTWVWSMDGSTLEDSSLEVTAVDGEWLADYGMLGIDLVVGLGIQAEIRDENGNATSVDLPVPDPRIVASITEDWFYIADFLPGTTLDITIYASKNAEDHIWQSNEFMTDVNGFVWVDSEGWNLEPGNYLVVSDGDTSKDLEIEGFTFDVFNLTNGQLSGTAPSGRNVWIGIGFQDQDAWTMNVAADSGVWTADFEQPVPSDYWWVAAQIYDSDGDASQLRPSQIYPTIFAWLEWDLVDGHGWRGGEIITLTINDGEHVLTQVAGTTKLIFDLNATGHDLTIGDQITMSDGLITKQLLIPDLKITDYDLGAKAISGTYDPSLGFRTSVDGQWPTEIIFDGDTWKAYFENLGPSMWGDAIQRDGDSDEAAATIQTPNPNLYALPDENRIFAQVWIAGFDLELAVYNSIGEVLHTDTKMVDPPSEVPWTVVIFEGFDIKPGQRIVLSQRGYVRELLVTSLRVTGFDYDTKQVIGTGDAGAHIFIRINGEDVWGYVSGDGNWAITHPQLAPGVWGEAIQPDGVDGDETRDGFQAPWE